MALMISISSYISSGYTNPVIWRLYEAGSGVLVDTHTELPPHGQVYNFSFISNIRDIVYRIDLYDQPGGVGIGNLIKSHNVTVSTSTLTLDADVELIVDGGQAIDPVSGAATSPPNADLVGKSYYVEERGIGKLFETREIEVVVNADGGFSLTGDNLFNAGDKFVIRIRPQVVVNPPGSQTISIYKDIVFITADTALSSADFGKLLIVDGDLPVVTLQLPAIASIIEKQPLFIESVGSTHINVVIKAAVGEYITATADTSNTFILSRATTARIINLAGTLYGCTDDNDIKCRGQIEYGYSVGLNRLWANGTEYLTANYPGLKKAMDAMQTGSVVTYTQWNSTSAINGMTVYPYKGFFALSDDALNFKIPDLRNLTIRSLRYSDSTTDSERLTQGAGSYQHQEMLLHNHTIGSSNSGASGSDNADPVRSSLSGSPNTKGGLGAGKTIGQYGGTETRSSNVGLIPLIII